MKAATLLLAILSAACLGDDPPRRGATEVRIVNAGETAIDSVVVLVTGASYFLGSIAPGDSVTVATKPRSESHAEVLRAGSPDTLNLGGYFEPGYGGRVRAEITRDSVVRSVQAQGGYSDY